MSYIQPENCNRVNSIKQRFESPTEANTSPEPKCIREKTKESLCRTLSASPIAPRKNLKLNVIRQLSNPGRNIKRTPAFRGDKLSRTKNLNSPTKEKIVSLVDKNVKLFEDKPEYGKLGKVKKKESTFADPTAVYDDVDSIILYNRGCGSKDLRSKLKDDTGYGKLVTGENGRSKDSRSQSLDRLNNKQTSSAKVYEQKESVRTTVISRHKNISGASDLPESIAESGALNHDQFSGGDEAASFQLNKFLKNGVEYTKVMKTKSFKQRSNENQQSVHNSDDEEGEFPDIREELSRRKYEALKKSSEPSFAAFESDLYRTKRTVSKNLSEEDRFPQLFTNEDVGSGQTKLEFVPVMDIILKEKRNNVARESSLPLKKSDDTFQELTDTLQAALKAPLPSGPPPKKPPRTFAHSPIANRSPVDDYEEVDGFWQKIKAPIEDPALDLPDSTREKIHSFLHDAGFKQFQKSTKNKMRITTAEENDTSAGNKIPTRNERPQAEFKGQEESRSSAQRATNFDSRLRRIEERDKGSSIFKSNEEKSGEYEPISTSDSNTCNLSVSLAKLGIDSKDRTIDSEGQSFSPVDSTSRLRESLSPIHPINESASSEDRCSATPLNISYSPRKFKTSPVRSSSSGKLRTSKDSKEMLDKLEHVLTQHQKACGPKVIIPRTDKFELGITGQDETETRNEISRHKEIFQKRLSRTLEDSRKLGPLPNIPLPNSPEEPERRNLGFDCLPSLNCAGNSSIYERIQNPDFKTYLTDNKSSSSLERSENIYIKSGLGVPKNSQFYLDNSRKNSLDAINPDPYDTLLISPASKRLSNELTTFSDAKRQMINASKKKEHVYAEPFAFNTNYSTDVTRFESGTSSPRNQRRFHPSKPEESPKSFKKGAELHYMCTPIPTAYVETNNNHIENDLTMVKSRHESDTAKKSFLKLAILARPSPNKFDKTKIEQLLDQAFGQPVMAGSETPTDSNTSSDTDSLASTTSISEETTKFSEKLQIFQEKEKSFRPSKAELHRSQTEKRKHYVRRVSSKFSDRKEGLAANRLDHLFEVCLLVELNLSTRKPYVKDKYPIHAVTPAWIENFCFPDGLDWPPLESDQNLAYTFVLTDEKGNRRYGYCRRVKPEGAPVCLPLAYCLITKNRASGFYAKLLDELESRHGQPDIARRSFIEQLYYSAIPKPGEALRLKPQLNEAVNDTVNGVDNCTGPDNVVVSKFTNSYGKTYNSVAMPKLDTAPLKSERPKIHNGDLSDGFKNLEFSDNEYAILRLDDHRLDEKDMSQLFDAVSIKVLLILFASLLLERKVVLTCNKLSKLSSCVEALQSLLYPFSWPHPFIPFLPNIPEFSEILQAPSPFVIGILKQRNGFTIQVSQLEDGIVVDLDNSKVISAVGDESSILPSRLQKGLKSALQIVSNSTKSGDGFRNFLVSEAFLRVFVETCAHCDSHIVTQQDGKTVFEKESFVKAGPSRSVQYFLEWFVETTMFSQFMQDRLLRVGLNMPSGDQMKLFDQRLADYLKAADKNAQTKKGSNKKKTLGDRFKDLTNFSN